MGQTRVFTDSAEAPMMLEGPAFVVNLEWEINADLDLAAVCVPRNGEEADLVYYGSTGSRCESPYVHLAVDHQGGGRRKLRREHMVVARADLHERIFLFVWNHDAIANKKGRLSDAKAGAWKATLTDRFNSRAIIEQRFGAEQNMTLVGELKEKRFTPILRSTYVGCYLELVAELRRLGGIDLEVAA